MIAYGDRLESAYIAKEKVRAVKIGSLLLSATKELLSFIFFRGDAEADILPVAEPIARINAVRTSEIDLAISFQRVDHRLIGKIW